MDYLSKGLPQSGGRGHDTRWNDSDVVRISHYQFLFSFLEFYLFSVATVHFHAVLWRQTSP